jgi:ribose/xylose/arabinose/galactoside ABC-type transport system permease subunit/ABC-type branched-subunit amino acid transport system ATPase component
MPQDQVQTAVSPGLRGRIKVADRWRRRRETIVPGEASGRFGLAVVAAFLVLLFSLRSSNFLSTDNALSIALALSAVGIVIIGSAALLISGNVDLSIGSMYGLIAVSVGQIAANTHSTPAAVIAGPLLGLVLGALNGALVRYMRISPLIVTIATLAVFRGLAFVVSGGVPVYGFSEDFLNVGRAGFGGLTVPIIVAAVVFVVGSFLLVRTRSGLRVYAIGGDERAAAMNGVAVGRTVIALYALNGALVGIAALLVTARLGSVSPNLGLQFEFDVLTAAILGGVAFSGGSGRPVGILIGAVTIGILNAGLLFEGLEDYWQQIAKGMVLLLALVADQLVQRRRESGPTRFRLLRDRRRSRPAEPTAPGEAAGTGRPGESVEPLRRPRPDTGPDGRRTVHSGDPVLIAKGLTRRYGPVVALNSADLVARAGEVLCLVGDNGAGKSTLVKILSGAVRPDSGEIQLDGRQVDLGSPRAARAVGIQTVFQDLALCPPLSVAHNFVLGDEPIRRVLGLIPVRDDVAAETRADERLRDLGVRLPSCRVAVQRLSGGQRQSVAIARSLHEGLRVLILDEPTAALGVQQTRNVLDLIRTVARHGTAVIMITHDIETVLAIADSITVLRLGSVVHAGPAADVDALAIGGDSAGGNLAAGVAITARDRGRPQIDCQVLVYPMTCRNLDANSRRRYSAGYLVSQDALEWCWRHYLPTGEDGSHPLVSPLLAASLVDLPPAVLVTAEFDVLRDEGEQYGCRLIEAGVAVRFRRYAGMLHGFLAHRGMVDAASLCLADLGRAVRNESSRRRDCARLVARAPRRRQDRPQEDAVRGALLAGNPEGERQPVFTTRGSSTTPPAERPGARPTGRAAH